MLDVNALAVAMERRAEGTRGREHGAWLNAALHRRLSRRTILKIGAAGSAAVPAGAGSTASSRVVHIGGDDDCFTIRLASGAQWSIDRRWFDGAPCLRWERSARAFSVELEAAEFPGLEMRCDLSVRGELYRGGWQARFEFPQWQAGGEVRLEDWIAGRDALLLAARFRRALAQAPGFHAFIGGRAAVRFEAPWNFELSGRDIAALRLNAEDRTFHSVLVRLPMESEPPLVTDVLRRTRLAFSGSGMLALGPRFGDATLSGCEHTAGYEAEIARLRSGGVQIASLWSADGVAGHVTMPLGASDAAPIRLPIENLRIAQLHSAAAPSSALLAGVQEGRHWREVGQASVRVAAGPQSVVMARTGADACAATLSGAQVEAFVVPFVGADVATFRRWREDHDAKQPSTPGMRLEDAFRFSSQDIRLDNFELEVSRIADGFSGIFRFRNLKLVSRRQQWKVMPFQAVDPCMLEFELGSQHLQEEALFSASLPGISAGNRDTLCTPTSSSEVRVIMLVARDAARAWHTPAAGTDPVVRDLLVKYVERLWTLLQGRVLELVSGLKDADFELVDAVKTEGTSRPLPPEFHKFITTAWARQLRESNEGAFTALVEPARRAFPEVEFGSWSAKSIDSQPTRLLFEVIMASPGGGVPFDMDFLTGWAPSGAAPAGAPTYKEVVSVRARAADTNPELIKDEGLQDANGAPVPGLRTCGQGGPATAIELPYRLTISPITPSADEKPVAVRWLGPSGERAWGGSHVLWHTRLAGEGALFRALSSPDFLKKAQFFHPPRPYAANPKEFRTSLDAHDRHNIVALSSGYGHKALLGSSGVVPIDPRSTQEGLFVPTPFQVQRMLLTPLGASFDILGRWDPPGTRDGALTVSRWEHHARIRRDTAVTVEYKGFLMPLGIPAVLIKRTTREFKRTGQATNESYRAVLVQRYTIRVDRRAKAFPALGQPFGGRDWCFESITVEPGETPPLLPPELVAESNQIGAVSYGRQAFWPMVATSPQSQRCDVGKLFEFTVDAGICAFKVPLVFVDNEIAHTPSKLKIVLRGYLEQVFARRAELEQVFARRAGPGRDPGASLPVAKALAHVVRGEIEYIAGSSSRNTRHLTPWFVLGVRLPQFRKGEAPLSPTACTEPPKLPPPSHPWEPADCVLDAAELRFDAERERQNQPPFYPRISEAVLESTLLASISGNAAMRFCAEYHPTYVEDAFDARFNAGAVFLRFVGKPPRMDFGGNTAASGGAMSPTTDIVAISRDHGPVGGKGENEPVLASFNCPPVRVCPPPLPPGVLATLGSAAASAPTPPDPVAKFMQGVSDPMEYFGNVLGDAKLLGCVRLVDIVKTAMQVSGTRVPRIDQKEIFDGIVEVVRPILQGTGDASLQSLQKLKEQLDKEGAPIAARAKLAPCLNGAIDALQQAQAEVDAPTPRGERLAGLISAAASHLRQFARDAQALAENPVSLLPPAAQAVIGQVQEVLNQFEAIRQAVDNLPKTLREVLLAEARAQAAQMRTILERAIDEQLKKLQVQAQAQLAAATVTAYAVVAEWVNQLDAEFTSLENAILEAAADRAATALVKIADRTVQFRGWYALAQQQSNQLLAAYRQGAPDLLGELRANAVGSGTTEGGIKRIDAALRTLAELQKFTEVQPTGASPSELTTAILVLQRAIVQLREQLFSLREFLRKLPDPATARVTDAIVACRLMLDVIQKVQGILRKTGELLKASDEVARRQSAALPPDPRRFVTDVANAIVTVGVRSALAALAGKLRSAPESIPETEDQALAAAKEIRQQLTESLDAAVSLLGRLEQQQQDVEAFLRDTEQQLMDTTHRQLGLLLSCLVPPAGLLNAAVKWQKAIGDAEAKLAGRLNDLCGWLGKVPPLDLQPGGLLSVPLQERIGALAVRMADIKQTCGAGTNVRLRLQDAGKLLGRLTALAADVRRVVELVATAMHGGSLGVLVDGRKVVDELIAALGLPTRLRIGYEWATDIEEFPRGGGAVFRPVKAMGSGPGRQPQLGIRVRTEVDLRRGGPPQVDVSGYIDAFDLHLFGSAPFLIVKLDRVRFTSRSGEPLKLDVRVNDVAFGQALKFVDDLAKYLAGASGLYVKPWFAPVPGIEIGYRFNKDILQLAAVTLQNVSMSIAVILPFDNSPARFRVAVGSRQKPVLASVGIYGGGFFVAMTMRADTMELLEASMEYGLVTGVEFGGVIEGTAKVTAGIYIALGVRDEITGFFNASGAFSVAHIFTAGASLCVSLARKKGKMEGDALYTFEFSLGIVDYSYSVDVAYLKEGKDDMSTSADGSSSSGPQQAAAGVASAYGGLTDVGRSLQAMGASGGSPETPGERPERNRRAIRIEEKAQQPSGARTVRASPGLASPDIWNAYWAAFSDLDAEEAPMCTVTGRTRK